MRNKNAKVSDPNSFVTCAGSRVKTVYSSKVLPTGEIALTPSGKEDIQDYINSFRETTDMSYILHQLALGNTAVLNQKQMMYGDFTDVPESLAEAQQMLIDGEVAFYKLPLDVRQQFDNNFRNWLFTSGQPEWIKKMEKLITTEEVNAETKEAAAAESEVTE